jgi:hypothetical protein
VEGWRILRVFAGGQSVDRYRKDLLAPSVCPRLCNRRLGGIGRHHGALKPLPLALAGILAVVLAGSPASAAVSGLRTTPCRWTPWRYRPPPWRLKPSPWCWPAARPRAPLSAAFERPFGDPTPWRYRPPPWRVEALAVLAGILAVGAGRRLARERRCQRPSNHAFAIDALAVSAATMAR